MIGFLSGKIIHSQNGSIILDVHGVGYQVHLAKSLPANKQVSRLFIHTHVKEEEISLFGFPTKAELELFKNLISVSGVGPRTALAILASAPGTDVISAIKNSSVDFFSAVPGIGKKTAQKLIIDLKSKLDSSPANLLDLDQNSNLVAGLVGLGFLKKDIQKIISRIDLKQELAEQIKQALKLLSQ